MDGIDNAIQPNIDSAEYQRLRDEWAGTSAARIMAERNLGKVCFNCGSDKGIELHHVVPLKLGGTNNLSNIVVLCHRCHCAAHHGRHIRNYCNKEVSGRPHKVSNEQFEEAVKDYIDFKIGGSECKKRMGLSKSTHIADTSCYKKLKKEKGIARLKNNIDLIINKRGKITAGDTAGYIIYANGKTVNIYYGA